MWHCNINSKQYGPVEIELLQAWAKESRLSPKDLVWREGMIDWQAADTIPELKGFFAPPVQGAAPGVIPSGNKKVPGEAIASMVLGILSIFPFYCIGFILGPLAISYRKKAISRIICNPETFGGQGFCTAGFITGIIGTILGSIMILYWIIILFAAGSGALR